MGVVNNEAVLDGGAYGAEDEDAMLTVLAGVLLNAVDKDGTFGKDDTAVYATGA